jgi:hypothetical protein
VPWSRVRNSSHSICRTVGSLVLTYSPLLVSHRIARYVEKKTKTKLRGLSPRANYTDRATTACRRSLCQLLRIEGATWSAWQIPTAVFSVFWTGRYVDNKYKVAGEINGFPCASMSGSIIMHIIVGVHWPHGTVLKVVPIFPSLTEGKAEGKLLKFKYFLLTNTRWENFIPISHSVCTMRSFFSLLQITEPFRRKVRRYCRRAGSPRRRERGIGKSLSQQNPPTSENVS